MPNFTDWLARTFFISQDQIDTNNQVAAAQSSEVAQQVADGSRSVTSGLQLQGQIAASSGDNFYNQNLGYSGLGGLVTDIATGGKSTNEPNTGFNLFGSTRTVLILAVIAAAVWFYWPKIIRHAAKIKTFRQ